MSARWRRSSIDLREIRATAVKGCLSRGAGQTKMIPNRVASHCGCYAYDSPRRNGVPIICPPVCFLALVAKFAANLGGFSPQFGRFRGASGLSDGVRQIIHDGRNFTFLAPG